jgi:hypothetical protein
MEQVQITDPVRHEIAKVRNGGLDTNLQDQTTRVYTNHLARTIAGPLTLADDWALNTYDLLLPAGHGLVGGEDLFVYSGTGAMSVRVISVTPGPPDTINVDTLASQTFDDATTEIYCG